MPPAKIDPLEVAVTELVTAHIVNDLQTRARQMGERLEEFRQLVLSFVAHTDMSQTRFGYEAAGQVDFVRLVKAGRDFRMSTVLKVLAFIADQDARKSVETKAVSK